jgi:hypothetical protein
MSDSKINCPNCGTAIDVNDILSHQLEEELKKKYSLEFAEKNKELENQKKELVDGRLALEEKKKKENELFNERLEKQRKVDSLEIESKLKIKLSEEQEEQFKAFQRELAEKSEKIKELNKSKVEIEKLKREKDELGDKLKAENEKVLNEKIKHAKEEASKNLTESFLLKEKEYQQQLEQAKKSAEELKRKMEQGSMQLQGEVQELAIEDELRTLFPFDQIDEVSKGIRGADCIQTVVNKSQEICGKIIYESKRTANFTNDWIPKLKGDMLAAGADVAILITQTLPKDQKSFNIQDGVWICSYSEFKSLALVIRDGIIKINSTKSSNENRGDKMHMLYDYLTGNEFKHQVEAIVEGFTTLKSELDREKRAMQRIWKDREKQIEKVIMNTIDLYGSVKGIAGSSVKNIDSLNLDDNLLEMDDADQ